MTDYVLEQDPDGAWHARSEAGERITNVAGWEALARLPDGDRVQWSSTNALSRFRGQFGEPPSDFDTRRMSVREPS